MSLEIEATTDASEALATGQSFLERDPVETTVIGSVLQARSNEQSSDGDVVPTGRYWIARNAGGVVGIGMRSPVDFIFSMAAESPDVARAFARTLNDSEDDLNAASGEARMSAAFAGEWASLRSCPVEVSGAQQLYELEEPTNPEPQPDQDLALRLAERADIELMCEWFVGFDAETFKHGIDPGPLVRSKMGSLWILSDKGEPCAMAAATPAAGGVRRVQAVYTPNDKRRRGYGAAVTAGVSRAVQAGGHRAVLFTELKNPGSNRIYRRLGYKPRGEFMNWQLGE